MSNIAEVIEQNFLKLQKIVEKSAPVLSKAFPEDDGSLVISKIHPCNLEDILTAISPFIKRLPVNADNLELLLPSSELEYLKSAIINSCNNINELVSKMVSFYGENFEFSPTRNGFILTSPDGQRTEDLKPFFQKVTTELDNIRGTIRDVGLWLNKSSKNDSITESIKTLKNERENYASAVGELNSKLKEHENKIGEIAALLTEIEGYKSSIESASTESLNGLQAINNNKNDVISAVETISEQKTNLEKILGQEEELKEKIHSAILGLDGFDQKLTKHSADVGVYAVGATNLMNKLKENLEQLEEARREAVEIIATATSASLAGAFAKEATLRAKSSTNYFGWVVASLAVISAIGLFLILNHTETLTYIDYIPRILMMVPLSFIALVANKQLATNRQVREEYAHKSSLSLSFEGYRRLIEDDQETHTKFFNDTVSELRKNPADRLETQENEIDTISRLVKTLNKCPDLLKTITENLTLGNSANKMFAYNDNSNPKRRKTDGIIDSTAKIVANDEVVKAS